jgi:antitoxin VapB
MAMQRARAKIFANGGSQAVRLPKRFRVDAKEVEIWREGENLLLRPIKKPRFATWQEMFDAIDKRGSDLTIEDRQQPAEADVRISFDD